MTPHAIIAPAQDSEPAPKSDIERPTHCALTHVITGTGRCGTRYTTELLKAAGTTANHESIFSSTSGGMKVNTLIEIDVSVWAGFYLPIEWARVALQVRDPLLTIATWADRATFADTNRQTAPMFNQLSERLGGLPEPGSTFKERIPPVATFWCRWNRMCEEHSETWWRVEDLPNQTLADFVGIDLEILQEAAKDIETNFGTHGRPNKVTLQDIPDDIWPEFQETASHYGYHYER
jgi:hypothetical protein